jgi:hypothetical protein
MVQVWGGSPDSVLLLTCRLHHLFPGHLLLVGPGCLEHRRCFVQRESSRSPVDWRSSGFGAPVVLLGASVGEM